MDTGASSWLPAAADVRVQLPEEDSEGAGWAVPLLGETEDEEEGPEGLADAHGVAGPAADLGRER